MKSPRKALAALQLLLAACALLAGLDLHALEFAAPAGAVAAADGQLSLHGEDCHHREHVPATHDTHHCVACKVGVARAHGLPPAAAMHAPDAPSALAEAAQAPRAAVAPQRGTLGARGPPGTVG
jgi:hypothetical protein